MPIDYRRNLSTPKSKCPASMEMRLRDPKCRNEMKDRPHKNPHDKPEPDPPKPDPKPDPPKPDPPDPKPKPPRPDPRPVPNPKPDFNAPRPIPYHTSSSMPVSATGMAVGGASAGLAYGAYNSGKIANLTRGYRQLSTTDPAETELTNTRVLKPSARTFTEDPANRGGLQSFQDGENLEAGTQVAEESGTTGTAGQTPSSSTMTSSNAPSASYEPVEDLDGLEGELTDFRASGELDFNNFSRTFENTRASSLADTATSSGEGLGTIGEEGGIEMADLAGSALDSGLAGGGDALADLSVSADVGADIAGGGGGGLNPIADLVAGGVMAVGAGVAIGQLVSGAIDAHEKYVANEFNKMSGTQKLSDTQLQGMISKLNIDQANAKSNTEIRAIQKQINQLNNVVKSGQQGVVYTDSKGNQQIAFTLSNADLAKAIKTYQANPNAFKGLSSQQLEIMGLNPDMSKGASGAKGFDKNGVYTPKGSYDTKNIANNYLAPNRQGDLTGQKSINEGFNEAIKPQAMKAYEKQFEGQIDNATNKADKTALTLQYNAWRASQGMDTYGDQQKIENLNKRFKQGKITYAELMTKSQALMASVKENEANAGKAYEEYQQQQYKARMLAEEQEEETIEAQEAEVDKINQAQNALSTLTQLQTNLDNQKATFTAQASSALTRQQTQTNTAVNNIQSGIDRLNTALATLQNQANTYTSQGKPVPKNLTSAITSMNKNIQLQQANQARVQQQGTQAGQNIMNNLSKTNTLLSNTQSTITAKTAQAQAVVNNTPTTGSQSAPKPATTNT